MTEDLFGHPERNRLTTRSAKRRDAWYRSAARRLAHMHAAYGNGPDGQTCKGCLYLVRYKPGASTFLKCRLFGVSGSEASDWRAKWPACGKYTRTADAP